MPFQAVDKCMEPPKTVCKQKGLNIIILGMTHGETQAQQNH